MVDQSVGEQCRDDSKAYRAAERAQEVPRADDDGTVPFSPSALALLPKMVEGYCQCDGFL